MPQLHAVLKLKINTIMDNQGKDKPSSETRPNKPNMRPKENGAGGSKSGGSTSDKVNKILKNK